MCEQVVARSGEPFRLDVPFRLDAPWPPVERMERFGIAGFGWGSAWLAVDGGLGTHLRHAAPGAPDRAVVRLHTSIALDERGRPRTD